MKKLWMFSLLLLVLFSNVIAGPGDVVEGPVDESAGQVGSGGETLPGSDSATLTAEETANPVGAVGPGVSGVDDLPDLGPTGSPVTGPVVELAPGMESAGSPVHEIGPDVSGREPGVTPSVLPGSVAEGLGSPVYADPSTASDASGAPGELTFYDTTDPEEEGVFVDQMSAIDNNDSLSKDQKAAEYQKLARKFEDDYNSAYGNTGVSGPVGPKELEYLSNAAEAEQKVIEMYQSKFAGGFRRASEIEAAQVRLSRVYGKMSDYYVETGNAGPKESLQQQAEYLNMASSSLEEAASKKWWQLFTDKTEKIEALDDIGQQLVTLRTRLDPIIHKDSFLARLKSMSEDKLGMTGTSDVASTITFANTARGVKRTIDEFNRIIKEGLLMNAKVLVPDSHISMYQKELNSFVSDPRVQEILKYDTAMSSRLHKDETSSGRGAKGEPRPYGTPVSPSVSPGVDIGVD